MNQYLTEQSILYLQQLKQPECAANETRRKGVPALFRRSIIAIGDAIRRFCAKVSGRVQRVKTALRGIEYPTKPV